MDYEYNKMEQRYIIRNNNNEFLSFGNCIFVKKQNIIFDSTTPWEFAEQCEGVEGRNWKFVFGPSVLTHLKNVGMSLIANHPNPSLNVIFKNSADPLDIWYIVFSPNTCIEVVFVD